MANKSMVETPYIETDRYTATNTFNNDPVDYSIKGDFKLSELKNLATSQLYTGGVQADLSGLISSDSPLRKNDSDNRFSSHAGFYDIHDSHSLSQTQKWIPKYDQFVFGLDNKEIQAQKDGWKEDWGKGLTRMVTDTVAGAIGGTVGTVYGLATAIATGSIDGFHDNAVMNTLSDWQDETTLSNQVYETHREEDMSLVRKLGNSSFWADKVVGTVGFTLGAIASEAIWAAIPGVGWGKIAATLPGKLGRFAVSHADDVARLGLTSKTAATQAGLRTGVKKAMSALAKESDEYLKMANILGKETGKKLDDLRGLVSASVSDESMKIIQSYTKSAARNADLVKNARFMVTSAGYEASVEEKNFRKLAIQDFVDYHRLNGTKPTDEELDNFSKTLEENSNKVFLTNMAILGVSNAALFGKYFGVKSPLSGTSEWANKNIFKLGTKAGKDGTYRALNARWYNKAAKKLTGLGKNALSEGVFEEGGQGIASATISNFVKSSYDKDYMDRTDSMYKSFTEAVGHQFGSKEGQEEMFIGALIGGLFGGAGSLGRKPVQDTYKGQEQVAGFQNEATKYIKENLTPLVYTSLDLSSKVAMANRNQAITEELQEAQAKGNALAIEQAKTKGLISLYEQAYALGKGDFFEGVLGKEMSQISTRDISKEWGISIEEAEDYKEATIDNMQKTVADYKANREFAENIFGNGRIGGITKDKEGNELSTQNLINATAFGITMSNTSKKVLNESHAVFDTLLANGTITEEVKNNIFGTITLSKVDNKTRERRDELVERKNTIDARIEELTEEITQAGLRQQTQSEVEELKDKSMKLKETQASLSEVEQALQVLDQEIVQKYAKGEQGTLKTQTFIDGLTELKDNIYSLPEKDKIRVNALLETMIDAVEHIKSYDDMVDKLINPDFRFRTYQGIFGKVIAPRLSIAEATREALLNWYEKPNNDITIFDINSESVEEEEEVQEEEEEEPTPIPPVVNTPPDDNDNEEVKENKLSIPTAISKLVERLENNKKDSVKIQTTIDNLIDDLVEADDALSKYHEEVKDKLAELKTKLHYKGNRLKGVKNKITAIEDTLNAYQQAFDEVEQRIQEEEINLAELKEAERKIVDQIAYYRDLHARDVTTKGAIIQEEEDLKELHTSVKQKITALEHLIDGLKELLVNLEETFNKIVDRFYEKSKIKRPKGKITPQSLLNDIEKKEPFKYVYQKNEATKAKDKTNLYIERKAEEKNSLSQAEQELESFEKELQRVEELQEYLNELESLADELVIGPSKIEVGAKTPSERIQDIYISDEYLQDSDEFDADDIEDIEEITQEDIDRYVELLNNQDLTEEEIEERNKLKSKLFRYNFAKGSYYGETNLLELIELNNSLRNQAAQSVKRTVTEEDLGKIIDDAQNKGEALTSYKVSNTPYGAYSSKGGMTLHRFKMSTFFDFVKKHHGDKSALKLVILDNNGEEIGSKLPKTNDEIDELQFKHDDMIFEINLPSGDSFFGKINRKSQINLEQRNIEELFPGKVKLLKVAGQKTNYASILEKNTDGNYSILELPEAEGREYDPVAANNVSLKDEKGNPTKLKATHSFSDPYNARLLDSLYGSEKAHKKKTGKTRRETAKTDPNYINRANIDLNKNGIVGGLKRSERNTSKEFIALRQEAIEKGRADVEIEDIYINQPKIRLNENGTPIMTTIHKGDKNILGFYSAHTGSSGDLVYSDNITGVNRDFVETIRGGDNIMYYAIYKQGANKIAFPIEYTPPFIDLTRELDNILDAFASRDFTAIMVNKMIDAYDIDHDKINDIDEINRVRFEQVKVYDNNVMADTALSFVNPNDAFLNPKFRLKLDNKKVITNTQPKSGKPSTKNNNVCKK